VVETDAAPGRGGSAELVPGMPVDVFIKTPGRTALS
jgi:hypothetical protein